MKLKLVLFATLFLSILTRTIWLKHTPARLTTDEMSLGYNAYSILKTGKDEWNKILPLSFTAFGDYKLPAYIYASVPFIGAFGLNPISIKIPSIISGLIIVMAIYLLVKQISQKQTLAIIAALIAAINPWPVHLSRQALESNLALAFFSLAIYLTQKALKSPSKKLIISAGILFGLTFYSYIAYRFITTVLILCLIFYHFWEKNYKTLNLIKKIGLVILITIIPLLPQLFRFSNHARFSQVSMFTDSGVVSEVIEDNNFCYLNNQSFLPKICRLLFNKPSVWTFRFIKNYSQFILPSFLFLEGDQSHYLNVPGFGAFFAFLLPFYIFGFYYFESHYKQKNLVNFAFFLAPIPSALVDSPQLVRGSALIPFICLFTAIGIYQSLKILNHFIIFVILTFGIFSITHYYLQYFIIYPSQYDDVASKIPPVLAEFLVNNQEIYDHFYFSYTIANQHIFTAFYLRLDPAWYQQNVVRPQPDNLGFSHPTQIGNKFYFGWLQLKDVICNPEFRKTAFITNESEPTSATITIKNFSKVHDQIKIYDIDQIRQQLNMNQSLESYCN